MAHALAPAATITIRNLDGRVKERLRIRAAMNGRSMEAEARSILAVALAVEVDDAPDLAEAIRRRVAPFGGIDLEEHPAVTIGASPSFDR
ncbi:plasmid stabilization protein [Methylobacterium sp. WL8]|uniref:FitA-like ribbon-helix-helix domain-containing protein n=1 Tax=Methylobacterium sp. WL8 TaxID=2603899 RepID=UPI0011CC604B|nr:plasmid stabilization protein [Methylobacterium sp. WL8]TXN78587.1 plasmid stabilization protein [Methylobacterium sp. WL8]